MNSSPSLPSPFLPISFILSLLLFLSLPFLLFLSGGGGRRRKGRERERKGEGGKERKEGERKKKKGRRKRGNKEAQKVKSTWQWWFAIWECQQRCLDWRISANQDLPLLIDVVPV